MTDAKHGAPAAVAAVKSPSACDKPSQLQSWLWMLYESACNDMALCVAAHPWLGRIQLGTVYGCLVSMMIVMLASILSKLGLVDEHLASHVVIGALNVLVSGPYMFFLLLWTDVVIRISTQLLESVLACVVTASLAFAAFLEMARHFDILEPRTHATSSMIARDLAFGTFIILVCVAAARSVRGVLARRSKAVADRKRQ